MRREKTREGREGEAECLGVQGPVHQGELPSVRLERKDREVRAEVTGLPSEGPWSLALAPAALPSTPRHTVAPLTLLLPRECTWDVRVYVMPWW